MAARRARRGARRTSRGGARPSARGCRRTLGRPPRLPVGAASAVGRRDGRTTSRGRRRRRSSRAGSESSQRVDLPLRSWPRRRRLDDVADRSAASGRRRARRVVRASTATSGTVPSIASVRRGSRSCSTATRPRAETLLGALADRRRVCRTESTIALSAGVTEIAEGDDERAALGRAEHALWQATQAGRGTVVVALPGQSARTPPSLFAGPRRPARRVQCARGTSFEVASPA